MLAQQSEEAGDQSPIDHLARALLDGMIVNAAYVLVLPGICSRPCG